MGYKFGRVYLSQYIFDRKVFELTGDAADDWKEKVFPSEVDIANAVMEEAQNLQTLKNFSHVQMLTAGSSVVLLWRLVILWIL